MPQEGRVEAIMNRENTKCKKLTISIRFIVVLFCFVDVLIVTPLIVSPVVSLIGVVFVVVVVIVCGGTDAVSLSVLLSCT